MNPETNDHSEFLPDEIAEIIREAEQRVEMLTATLLEIEKERNWVRNLVTNLRVHQREITTTTQLLEDQWALPEIEDRP